MKPIDIYDEVTPVDPAEEFLAAARAELQRRAELARRDRRAKGKRTRAARRLNRRR